MLLIKINQLLGRVKIRFKKTEKISYRKKVVKTIKNKKYIHKTKKFKKIKYKLNFILTQETGEAGLKSIALILICLLFVLIGTMIPIIMITGTITWIIAKFFELPGIAGAFKAILGVYCKVNGTTEDILGAAKDSSGFLKKVFGKAKDLGNAAVDAAADGIAVVPVIGDPLSTVVQGAGAVVTSPLLLVEKAADLASFGVEYLQKLSELVCRFNDFARDLERAGYKDALKVALDCSKWDENRYGPLDSPDNSTKDGTPKFCIEGDPEKDKSNSTIPTWLLTIYLQAGNKHNVPWPLLAAINYNDTNLGQGNWTEPVEDADPASANGRVGWIPFNESEWKNTATSDEGSTAPRFFGDPYSGKQGSKIYRLRNGDPEYNPKKPWKRETVEKNTCPVPIDENGTSLQIDSNGIDVSGVDAVADKEKRIWDKVFKKWAQREEANSNLTFSNIKTVLSQAPKKGARDSDNELVQKAANTYQLPYWSLWGLYGHYSEYGKFPDEGKSFFGIASEKQRKKSLYQQAKYTAKTLQAFYKDFSGGDLPVTGTGQSYAGSGSIAADPIPADLQDEAKKLIGNKGIATTYTFGGGSDGSEGGGAYTGGMTKEAWGVAYLLKGNPAGLGLRDALGLVLKVKNLDNNKIIEVPILDNGSGGNPINGQPKIMDFTPAVSEVMDGTREADTNPRVEIVDVIGYLNKEDAMAYSKGEKTGGVSYGSVPNVSVNFEPDGHFDVCDPVDAIFGLAKWLKENGASGTEWKEAELLAQQLDNAEGGDMNDDGNVTVPGEVPPLIWPVDKQYNSTISGFGQRGGRLHAGWDIPAPEGANYYAVADGKVEVAGWTGGYGNYLCIKISKDISVCNGHMSQIGVKVGQSVKQGQVVGKIGNTGHSFGAHSHLEFKYQGTPQDPKGYIGNVLLKINGKFNPGDAVPPSNIGFGGEVAGNGLAKGGSSGDSNDSGDPGTTDADYKITKLLVIGDSLAVGTKDKIKDKMGSDVEVITDAESGRPTKDGTIALKGRKDDANDAVFISLGTNDDPNNKEAFETEVKNIKELTKQSKCVVWANLAGAKDYGALNTILDNQAKKSSNMKILDFASMVKEDKIEMSSDKIHPTAEGYSQRANAVADLLKNNCSQNESEELDSPEFQKISTPKCFDDRLQDFPELNTMLKRNTNKALSLDTCLDASVKPTQDECTENQETYARIDSVIRSYGIAAAKTFKVKEPLMSALVIYMSNSGCNLGEKDGRSGFAKMKQSDLKSWAVDTNKNGFKTTELADDMFSAARFLKANNVDKNPKAALDKYLDGLSGKTERRDAILAISYQLGYDTTEIKSSLKETNIGKAVAKRNHVINTDLTIGEDKVCENATTYTTCIAAIYIKVLKDFNSKKKENKDKELGELGGGCGTFDGDKISISDLPDIKDKGYSSGPKEMIQNKVRKGINTTNNPTWGRKDVVEATVAVTKAFIKCYPEYKDKWKNSIIINDFGGGTAGNKYCLDPNGQCNAGHKSHMNGGDNDYIITEMRFDLKGSYDKEKAITLAALFLRAGAVNIYFNDPEVEEFFIKNRAKEKKRFPEVASKYKAWSDKPLFHQTNHENHFHVRWYSEAANDPNPTVKVYVGEGNPDAGDSSQEKVDDKENKEIKDLQKKRDKDPCAADHLGNRNENCFGPYEIGD